MCYDIPSHGNINVSGLGEGVVVNASLVPLVGDSALFVNGMNVSSPASVTNNDTIRISVCAPDEGAVLDAVRLKALVSDCS